MAKKVAKSVLAQKIGDRANKAHSQHKDDETDYGGGSGDLPAGINGGVAELREAKIDLYKSGDFEGQPYFHAHAVVIEPKKFDGITVGGLLTMIQEPLCDTPGRSRSTFDEHYAWVLNELRKLGVDTSSIGDADELELVILPELKEAKPFIRFETWKGKKTPQYPNPRTNHRWNGLAEGYTMDESTPEVADNTAAEEEDESEEETVDYATLGRLADEDDEDAQTQLAAAAEEAGIDPDEIATWTEIAEMLSDEADDEVEEPEEEVEEEVEEEEAEEESEGPEPPQKDDVMWMRKPRTKTYIEVIVTASYAGKKTCNVKDLDDDTPYKSVPWDSLFEEKPRK